MGYLLRYEAKSLQSFILRTNRLREIKGGSQLIKNLEKLLCSVLEAQKQAGNGYDRILNKAAGGANILFPNRESAKAFKDAWPMLAERTTPGLDILVDYVEFSEDKDSWDAWKKLQRKLRDQRNRKMAELPEATPAVFRAPRTGLPACTKSTPRRGERQERQDRALSKRSEAGKPEGRNNEPIGMILDEEQEWATDLSKHMPGETIATIHIDGNDLGKRIQSILKKQTQNSNVLERVQRFSKCLSDITREAAKAGYQAALKKWKNADKDKKQVRDVFPGRPIILGGDDFTMIVRADLAFGFVKAYLETFERLSEEYKEELGGPLTACAGITFTSISFPFNMAHQLTEEICKYAKTQLRDQDKGNTASGVAFHRVTTSMIESFEQIRGTELAGADDEKGYLTAAPYTLGSINGFLCIEHLEELARCLQTFPNGPIRETIRLFGQNKEKAIEKWERLKGVMEDKPKTKAAWNKAIQIIRKYTNENDFGEFQRMYKDETKHIPLLDAWVLMRADLLK